MGMAEDRAQRAEEDRVRAAWNVSEMMIPGYGIWTQEGIKGLLDDRKAAQAALDHQSEEEAAARLHDTDPGRWGDHASPARMRRDRQRDRDEERYA